MARSPATPTITCKLREILGVHGITFMALAQGIGVPQPTVSHWCAGRNNPSLPLAMRCACVLSLMTGCVYTVEDIWKIAKEKAPAVSHRGQLARP